MSRRAWLLTFAAAFGLSLSIVFMTVFNAAVVGGGSVVVEIDTYGEMIPELLVLHFVVWPTITAALVVVILGE